MSAAAHLTVVSPPTASDTSPRAERIRRLQAEAVSLAKDHIGELERALETVNELALEISEGGDAYPVGARELCRRLADDACSRAMTLNAIVHKH